MKKVNLMGEFHLVPAEQFDEFLGALKGSFSISARPRNAKSSRELTVSPKAARRAFRAALIRRPGSEARNEARVFRPPPRSSRPRHFTHAAAPDRVSAAEARPPLATSDFAMALTAAVPRSAESRVRERTWERFASSVGVEPPDFFRRSAQSALDPAETVLTSFRGAVAAARLLRRPRRSIRQTECERRAGNVRRFHPPTELAKRSRFSRTPGIPRRAHRAVSAMAKSLARGRPALRGHLGPDPGSSVV